MTDSQLQLFLLDVCSAVGLSKIDAAEALARVRANRSAADIFDAFRRHLERDPTAEIVIGTGGGEYFCELYSPEANDAVQIAHGLSPQDAAAQLATVIRLEES